MFLWRGSGVVRSGGAGGGAIGYSGKQCKARPMHNISFATWVAAHVRKRGGYS
jgi:hypothetical protein